MEQKEIKNDGKIRFAFKPGIPTKEDVERLINFLDSISGQEKTDEKLPEKAPSKVAQRKRNNPDGD